MNGIKDTKSDTPMLKNDEKMYVYLKGSHFQQNNVLTSNNDHVINDNVVKIYIVKFILYKMLYLELCKLLKMLVLVNIIMKDMVYVLMKVKNLLTYEKEAILTILHRLET